MVSSGSDGLGLLRVSGSGHVEGFGEMVVLPAGSGPEERFISDFIDHFDTNISLSLFFLVCCFCVVNYLLYLFCKIIFCVVFRRKILLYFQYKQYMFIIWCVVVDFICLVKREGGKLRKEN